MWSNDPLGWCSKLHGEKKTCLAEHLGGGATGVTARKAPLESVFFGPGQANLLVPQC